MSKMLARACASILLLAVTLLWLPVSIWLTSLQQVLSPSVQLERVDGHWWRGQAHWRLPQQEGVYRLDWEIATWPNTFNWSLIHQYIEANGQFSAGFNSLTLRLANAYIDMALLQNITLLSKNLSLTGEPIQIQGGWLVYDWRAHRLSKFSGQADWSGAIYSPFLNSTSAIEVVHWRALGSLPNSQPNILLKNMSTQHTLIEAELSPLHNVEITIMPRFMEVLGHDWSGNKQYPAFVMVHPLLSD